MMAIPMQMAETTDINETCLSVRGRDTMTAGRQLDACRATLGRGVPLTANDRRDSLEGDGAERRVRQGVEDCMGELKVHRG
jgi:hypothetical protein